MYYGFFYNFCFVKMLSCLYKGSSSKNLFWRKRVSSNMKKISHTCIYFLKEHAFYKRKEKKSKNKKKKTKKHDIHFGNYSEDNNNLKLKISCKNLLPLSKKMFLNMTYTVKNT